MDETIPNVVAKLKADAEYVKQFKAAFGTEDVTATRMYLALSQFMCMLVSNNSKYDQVLNGTAAFTTQESTGKQLFEQKCASCHSGILFTDHAFKNNGLSLTNDIGRGRITLNTNDDHCFKVPSLRNIAKTTPYMHDGRFSTLEQVLNHYASGVQNTATLDTILKPNGQLGIPLTNDEKTNIILFLNTLTDETFIKNPLFAE
jgi:cytochrome c peroxidase